MSICLCLNGHHSKRFFVVDYVAVVGGEQGGPNYLPIGNPWQNNTVIGAVVVDRYSQTKLLMQVWGCRDLIAKVRVQYSTAGRW